MPHCIFHQIAFRQGAAIFDAMVVLGNGFFMQQAAKNVAASFSLPSELNRTGTNMTSSKHG